jgi:hypothetical protein
LAAIKKDRTALLWVDNSLKKWDSPDADKDLLKALGY